MQHDTLDLSNYSSDAILIHAGDALNTGTRMECLLFLEWLEVQNFRAKLWIAGNHCLFIEKNPEEFAAMLLHFPNITYLQDSGTTIDGIKFYGSPYSNMFYNWAFMAEEVDLEDIWEKIPLDTQVLITHGPAYHCNDLVKHSGGRDPHVGSKSLHWKKKELTELKVHISGHMLHGYGITEHRDFRSICPSVLNEQYKLVNKPITLEI